jgi:transcriptional regulator with XRE-family HTH domain
MSEERNFNNLKNWLLPQLEERQMSVEQFARAAGLTRGMVYFYLSDRNRPSEDATIRMCQVLGVPPEEGFAQYTPNKIGRPSPRSKK